MLIELKEGDKVEYTTDDGIIICATVIKDTTIEDDPFIPAYNYNVIEVETSSGEKKEWFWTNPFGNKLRKVIKPPKFRFNPKIYL